MNQFYPKKSLLTGTRWLARHILLAGILVLTGITVAHAVPKTWYLNGVQFDTDATANGSFVYDADTHTFSSIQIDVTSSSGTNSYDVQHPNIFNELNEPIALALVLQASLDLPSYPVLSLEFNTPLTNNGGTIDIIPRVNSFQGACSNVNCDSINEPFDDITVGRVTTVIFSPITSVDGASVPENQTSVIDVQATGEGTGLTFSLSGGADQALFNIDANTGVVTFILPPDFENPADADGGNNYNIEVTVTGSSGLTAVQNIVVTVLDVAEDAEDITPPSAFPESDRFPNGAGWYNSDVIITWNWADEMGGSGLDINNCTTSSTSSGEGMIDLTATCADLANNTYTATYTVQVDKTEPETVITNHNAGINSPNPTFEFDSIDAVSGGAGTECQINGEGWIPCFSPQLYVGLQWGINHTFEVRAIDNAGNIDTTPATFTWFLDPQPNEIRIKVDTIPENDRVFTFNTIGSGLPGSFELADEINPDLGGYFSVSGLQGDEFYEFTQVTVSEYALSISCDDPSSNTANSGNTAIIDLQYGELVTCTFTNTALDTTSPTASPTQLPTANVAGWNNSDVTITWNWNGEPGDSGIDINNCTTTSVVNTEGSSDHVAACSDLAGNSGQSATVSVNLDKTSPNTTITATPPTISVTDNATFEFIGSDALSGVSGFECTLDTGVILGRAPCTSPHNLTALTNGTYIFTVHTIDVAGNVDPTPASYTWTVDVPLSCAPGTYLANPGDASCTPASPGFFVATANATEQTACAGGTFSANSGAINCTQASPGSFVAIEGSATQTACSLGSFSANAGSTSCTMAEIAFYVDSEGAVVSIACPVNTTTRSIGSTDISDCIPINAAPVLDVIGNQTVDEGQLLEFTVSASDPNTGDTLTFQLGNPPTGAILTNNGDGTTTFNWTPDFTQAGNYIDVLFTVTDNGLPAQADMETITITVGDVNRPPQFDVLGSQNSDEGVELSFNVQAIDPDGNAITLAVSNPPSGAVFTDNGNGNGIFTWTPDFGQAGNYTVMFTATDDGAPVQSDTLDVTITIGSVNQPPVLSMIGDRTVAENELLEIILTASDPDGDNLSYSASNLPLGASFNDNGDGTATFSWIPDFGQAGSFPNVQFTLADNGVPVETVSETINIMVNPSELEPFASCGGFEVFETVEGDFIAPGFDGVVIVGSNGHDSLIGTDDPDLILGLDGADDIFGKKGDDVICGGRGADFIKGQRGNDTLYGQRGQDELFGGRGSDKLFGGKSDDELYGNQGADTLNGGNGDDFCRGGRGRDTLTKC